jgi:hypothetical protein
LDAAILRVILVVMGGNESAADFAIPCADAFEGPSGKDFAHIFLASAPYCFVCHTVPIHAGKRISSAIFVNSEAIAALALVGTRL